MMKCPFCTANINEAVTFRTSCPSCDKDLHSCLACRHYDKSKPHECVLYDTEPVRDKEKGNFCEEFQLKTVGISKPKDLPKVKSFNALFDD